MKELLICMHECATSYKPISKYTNLNKLQPNDLISLMKASRKENNDLRSKLRKVLADESNRVDENMHCDSQRVMDDSNIEDEFVKLHWEEKKKTFSSNAGGMRCHPMLMRFAIMLHSYSPAAYATLRSTRVLKLPVRINITELH